MSDRPAPPTPTFCIAPWMHVFGDERGLLRPCCMTQGEGPRAIHNTDEDGTPVAVHGPGSIERGWNSPFMRGLRRDMLAGTQPPVCARCFNEESLGIESYREDMNRMYADQIPGAVAATMADGSAPIELVTSADFRLGNACNLKCRMCSPISTKLLIPEWREMFDLPADEPRLLALERVNWFDEDAFWDNCERLIPSLTQLHFAGGEPMIINRMLDFLAKVVESGHAGRIGLSYVTNLTTLPDRVTTLWPAFREVHLTVSLDGHEPVNSLIRHPARFERIDTHLRRLVAERDRYNVENVTFNTTVQMYNVLNLVDLFEYLFTHPAGLLNTYPRLSLLEWPASFNIQVLPADLKALAISRLQAFLDAYEDRWPVQGDKLDRFKNSVQGVISHLRREDHTDLLPEFVKRTRQFDRARGHDTAVVIPEFAPLLAAATA
ncbi:MAG: twitch domain-containing radical SAM protein [Vicinamibacterales bacterium]